MLRWLVLNFPNWALLISAAALAMLVTVIGIWMLRRFFPRVSAADRSDMARLLLSMTGSLYGLILGFVIIAAWNNVVQSTPPSRTRRRASRR